MRRVERDGVSVGVTDKLIAEAWKPIMVREYVRALWRSGLEEASRQNPEAASTFVAASSLADQYGLDTLGGRVRRSLRNVGGHIPLAGGSTSPKLSARESQVITLVGRGSTTRQIAAALGLFSGNGDNAS